MAARRIRDVSRRMFGQNGGPAADDKDVAELRVRLAELEASKAAADLRKLEVEREIRGQELLERLRAETEAAELERVRAEAEAAEFERMRTEAEAAELEYMRAEAETEAVEAAHVQANGTGPELLAPEPTPDPAPPPVVALEPPGSYESDVPGLLVLWRRKGTVLLLTLLFGCAFGGVYFLLPERYESAVRLEARSSGEAEQSSFEFLQASQILARTYSEIGHSRVIADLVARRLPSARTHSSILGDVSVLTISDTPLIKITATQEKGSDARRLANVYADTLLRYVDRQSQPKGGSLSLVHRAESASRTAPRLPLMVAVGSLLGLLVGIAIAFFQERLDAAPKRSKEVQQ